MTNPVCDHQRGESTCQEALFEQLDVDGNGSLSAEEVEASVQSGHGITLGSHPVARPLHCGFMEWNIIKHDSDLESICFVEEVCACVYIATMYDIPMMFVTDVYKMCLSV